MNSVFFRVDGNGFKRYFSLYLRILMILAAGCFSLHTSAYAQSARLAVQKSLSPSETGEFIIKLRDNRSQTVASKMAAESGVTFLRKNKNHLLIHLNKASQEKMLALLASDPNIEYIEPNIRMHASSLPEDPAFSDQWGLKQIQAPQAWDEWAGGSKVTVAVIDTGVDYSHPDLAKRVDTAHDYDYVNYDSDALDDDGHGTHVAGIIAAELNDEGIAGVAGKADVKILPLKVLDHNGEGNMYDIAAAIMDAADLGASVINLSLGGEWDRATYGEPLLMEEAVKYAIDKGTVVVAAAGNDSADADKYIPASIPGVITVSSVNENLKLSDFSNYGSSVDISAPGEEIVSTWPGGRYMYASGTSMAAPFVSGVAALLKAQEPDLTVAALTDRLLDTATDLGKNGRDDQYGYGLVNAYQALKTDQGNDHTDKRLMKIMANVKKLSFKPGDTSHIAITAYYADDTEEDVTSQVEWTSSDAEVASVENGLVSAQTFGTAVITATFQGQTVSIPVTIAIKSLKPDHTKLSLRPNGTASIQLTAVLPDGTRTEIAGEKAVWHSENEEIASVENGVVTARDFGTATITAAYGGKTVKIRVEIRLTKLVAAPNKLLMKPADASTIVLTAVYGNDIEVVNDAAEWKTSNSTVAVYEAGHIVAKGFGKAAIAAAYKGKTVKISVDTSLKKLQADASKKTLKAGDTFKPAVTATYRDNSSGDVTDKAVWASSNEQVATVDESGEISAIGAGKATVSANYGGKRISVSLTVTE